jgi:hypothetical protein
LDINAKAKLICVRVSAEIFSGEYAMHPLRREVAVSCISIRKVE